MLSMLFIPTKKNKSPVKTTWLEEMQSQIIVFCELTEASQDVNTCICEWVNGTLTIAVLCSQKVNILGITYLHV